MDDLMFRGSFLIEEGQNLSPEAVCSLEALRGGVSVSFRKNKREFFKKDYIGPPEL